MGTRSYAFENVFGKLSVGDKMAAAGKLFLKGLFHEIIKWIIYRFRAEMIKQNNYTNRKFSECRHMAERSAGETIFFDLILDQIADQFKLNSVKIVFSTVRMF